MMRVMSQLREIYTKNLENKECIYDIFYHVSFYIYQMKYNSVQPTNMYIFTGTTIAYIGAW